LKKPSEHHACFTLLVKPLQDQHRQGFLLRGDTQITHTTSGRPLVLSENIVRILFVNLAVLADECLSELIAQAGAEPPNYLTAKAEWVKSKLGPSYQWAANGLLELCALRNAIVHANGRLNPSTIAILQKAGVADVRADHEISLSFGDLFRYRRALRTVLGEVDKLRAKRVAARE
ncbi:MAG: hypothetical protein ABIS20_03355, partial [Thermoanaerobaculia bacterium]